MISIAAEKPAWAAKPSPDRVDKTTSRSMARSGPKSPAPKALCHSMGSRHAVEDANTRAPQSTAADPGRAELAAWEKTENMRCMSACWAATVDCMAKSCC